MNGLRIVVADDEAHIRHIVSTKLQNAGFEVLPAADGEEALELCLAERPALLITDYQMPVLTGLELVQRLRQDDRTRDLPVVLLTARGSDLEPSEADTGIALFMSKPFSPRELLERVKGLIAAPAPAS